MSEIELKFQIPQAKLKALSRYVQQQNPERLQLNAKYFDTADLYLQQHQISLRQRLENEKWLQTLKAPKNNIERIEIETELNPHESNSIGLEPYLQEKSLQAVLFPALQSPLSVQFETQIQRQQIIQPFNGSEIEIAFDQGQITANDHAIQIHEIEFELKQGDIRDLTQAILPWIKKYHIWLDSGSKALKGQMLQQSCSAAPVQYQSALKLNAADDCDTALKKIIANCLEHLLPNSSAIALGQFSSEHVHQARVAIRRLRSALKTFAFESPAVSKAALWQQKLADLFRQFGTTRDRDALSESFMPQLIAAGSPIVQLPLLQETEAVSIPDIFQTPATTLLLLELIEFAYLPPQKSLKLKKQLNKRLHKMHAHICHAQTQFAHMQDAEKHQLRKRVKTLRYSVEFASSLYSKTKVKTYLKALKPLQDNLGRFNDLSVAYSLFEKNTQQQPEAWFVLGWITAEKQQLEKHIVKNLKRFSQVQPFW
ncbi:CHAD domain-containing protein [Acinetobacter bouvetii]|uniref:CHAD domain-containing protein n=1 Tax=Acinetobacter bouvetii TaxID=202951 RepID=A0A4Q7B015_9GAMM|nr:CHAD domain-containing protein [Acinetobacter bouvetii]RZG67907.1 CHAD domain-containing protein [Acinetobacter bouvetii]